MDARWLVTTQAGPYLTNQMKPHVALLVLPLLPLTLLAHDDKVDYDEQTLDVKSMVAEREAAAVAEQFKGITTNGEIPAGLFSVKPTGSTTVQNSGEERNPEDVRS